MTLTLKGKQMLKRFHKKYGVSRGNIVFYSYMSKYPKRTKRWHR